MNAIAYYRVSTKQQGSSGLGLEAQIESVEAYALAHGLTIVSAPGEYTEIETGTNKKARPKLKRAIEHAQRENAILLIAKLDRLARNVHFISGLIESGVKFVAVDMPEVDTLTIHVLAAVAEKEAELISQRTRAALAQAKERGVKLGNPQNLTPEARREGSRAVSRNAKAFYQGEINYIRMMRESGMSLRAIASQLNDEGKRTRRNKEFTPTTVRNILNYFDAG